MAPPQALQGQLAAAVGDLARLAKSQREMGALLDSLRALLQRMAAGGDDREEEEEEELEEEVGRACGGGLPAAAGGALELA